MWLLCKLECVDPSAGVLRRLWITGSKSGDTRTVTVTVTPIMYDINFYRNDGGALITTVSVSEGGTVGANMPNNPIETNYVFD